MNQIVISNACKTIKGRTVLSDISVSLGRGGIYGFFGVNGSGKTMLFRALSGLIRLDAGTINVFGKVVGKDVSFPPNLGLVLSAGFWDEYTGYKNLLLLASVRRRIGQEEIRAAMERVGLDPQDKRTCRSYSLGMRQRLEIAQAIMEHPDLLILDEPTNSLDADGLRMVLDVIKEQQAQGTTVLLASHNVAELRELCERKFAMSEGRLSEENDSGDDCALPSRQSDRAFRRGEGL